MSKVSKFIFFLLLLSPYAPFDVPLDLKSICPNGCKSYYYCDPIQKACVFKGFFPIYPLELFSTLIMMISSSLATSCGIGGGAVYSSMILGVEELPPNQAFPITNCLILICGLVTYVSFTLDKYDHPKNTFVNYDVAVIFGTSMLLGTKFGAILNRILSSTLLVLLLICLIIFTTYKTYKNIIKAKAKEAKIEQENKELKEKLLDENEENLEEQNTVELTEEDLRILNEDKDPLNWPRIKFLLMMEVLVVIDQFLEGSNTVPSFIGVVRCSLTYWAIFILFIIVCLILVKVSLNKVKKTQERKKELIPDFKNEVTENIEKNMYFSVAVAIFTGIVSSTLGIGGGMITNPVFISMGMDPKESSSTSNFLIIIAGLSTTFLFIMSGQLQIGYCLGLGSLCMVAALVGSIFILKYINKTGKSSILLIIMEYFLIASFFIAVYKLIVEDRGIDGFFGSLVKVKQFC